MNLDAPAFVVESPVTDQDGKLTGHTARVWVRSESRAIELRDNQLRAGRDCSYREVPIDQVPEEKRQPLLRARREAAALTQ